MPSDESPQTAKDEASAADLGRELESSALAEISAPPMFETGNCDLARAEVEDYDNQKKAAELKGLKQDIKARKRYAKNIFRLIVWWLVAMLLVLLLQGFSSDQRAHLSIYVNGCLIEGAYTFKLSDSVLLALIGGTTANVLGLFIFVVQYLFPKRDVGKSN